ncbi:MAG: hypothetical protein MUE41_10550 [Gemmatimonadaceae bacterium]|jgi:hypothetical protein|nr:hypothetical protein [Gemmatimonadaceae bacterium]
MTRRTLLLAAALLCSACEDSGNDVEIVLDTNGAPVALRDAALYRVELTAGTRTHRLVGSSFTTTRYGTPHSERLPLPDAGDLRIRVAVVTAAGDTLSEVRASLTLLAEHRYGVNIRVGGSRPIGACVGTVMQAPLRQPGTPAAAETLWVAYAGLPRGAIC